MVDANHESGDDSANVRPTWLNGLKPASASSLQASVFYRAGYEAARLERSHTTKQRSILVAIAASFLLSVATGAIGFKLGTRTSLTLASTSTEGRTKTDAMEVSSSGVEQKAAPGNLQGEDTLNIAPKDFLTKDGLLQGKVSDNIGNQNQFTKWWQSEFRRMLPNSQISVLGTGVKLGPIDADLDQIIVLTSAPRSDVKRVQPTKSPVLPELRMINEMRENQLRSLMDALL